jgi:uncharacterized OsmC-like protein
MDPTSARSNDEYSLHTIEDSGLASGRIDAAWGTMMMITTSPGIAVPSQRTLHCRTVAAGGFQQMNYVRKLPPIQLEERQGLAIDSNVATPSEILLAALGSCLATRIHADAVAGSIAVQTLEVSLEADIATSPMWGPVGREPEPVGFAAIRVTVNLQADAPLETLRMLVAHAVLWSPVANTIHDPVHLDVMLGQAERVVSDDVTEPES